MDSKTPDQILEGASPLLANKMKINIVPTGEVTTESGFRIEIKGNCVTIGKPGMHGCSIWIETDKVPEFIEKLQKIVQAAGAFAPKEIEV